MRLPKIFFFVLIFAFAPWFGCGGGGNGEEDAAAAEEAFLPKNPEGRDGEIRRLRRSSAPYRIGAEVRRRYSGERDYSLDYDEDDYEGPECETKAACKDICQRLVSSGRRTRCYKKPILLVEALDQAVFTLLSLSDVRSDPISPSLFYALFEMDRQIVPDLVRKDKMSEGDLRSFLAWTALNRDIARIIEDKDRSLLRDALKTLGGHQINTEKSNLWIGLNTGLIGREDSFLYLAADSDNEEAFIMANRILEKNVCNDALPCKQEMYCARTRTETRRRGRRRAAREDCRTPGETRRYSRSGLCYVHGGVVWSYLFDLIEDKEIRSADLEELVFSVEKCNKFCGKKKSKVCDAV